MPTYLMASEFNPRGEGTTRVLAAGSVEAVDEEQNGNQSLAIDRHFNSAVAVYTEASNELQLCCTSGHKHAQLQLGVDEAAVSRGYTPLSLSLWPWEQPQCYSVWSRFTKDLR